MDVLNTQKHLAASSDYELSSLLSNQLDEIDESLTPTITFSIHSINIWEVFFYHCHII